MHEMRVMHVMHETRDARDAIHTRDALATWSARGARDALSEVGR
jgi:hypothetical protein